MVADRYLFTITISIHAPVKGATRHGWRISSTQVISIHAPVKGATHVVLVLVQGQLDFNPRSREGSDLPGLDLMAYHLISIHAPVKGATSATVPPAWTRAHFNPRSREGSDRPFMQYPGLATRFQSTPP